MLLAALAIAFTSSINRNWNLGSSRNPPCMAVGCKMTLAFEEDALSCAAAKSVGTSESLPDITIDVASGISSGHSMRECQQNFRQKVCARNISSEHNHQNYSVRKTLNQR